MTEKRIAVNKVAGALGAEISGIDLSEPMDDETFAQVHQALLDNLVLFFRDQDISPEQHKGFGERFGSLNVHPYYVPLEGHPEILPLIKEPGDAENVGGVWHSDVTFLEEPAMGSILYALDVPPHGGDTMFANQYMAYDRLSQGMKELADNLVAVHTDEAFTDPGEQKKRRSNRSSKLHEEFSNDPIVNEHPVVRTHPETGRKGLYVNRVFTRKFRNMTRRESAPLLRFFCEHAVQPEFTCRFRWRKGSIAFWDNRCTQHYALNDYPDYRREMHRVTVNGDRPV